MERINVRELLINSYVDKKVERLTIRDFPNLERVVLKYACFSRLTELKVCQNENLRSIEVEEEEEDLFDKSRGCISNVILESIFMDDSLTYF